MSKIERISRPDDPRRCEAVTAQGQCQIVRIEPSKYCIMHGGASIKPNEQRLYRLHKYQARLEELKDHSGALGLRNEIGILRMTLEEILNKCDTAVDLMIHSAKISRLVNDIDKLVINSKKLEAGLGRLLDRQVVLSLAGQIVDVIAELEPNPDILAEIAKGIELVLDQTVLGVHNE